LFLRSATVPHDPSPNKEAIKMLERAVGLDPTYALVCHIQYVSTKDVTDAESLAGLGGR